jgi:opacity protein-like surface antigen
MRRILVPLLLLGLLIAPAAVLAADSPNYLTLKLGMYQPGDKDLGSDDPPPDLKFNSGFNGELVYGRKVMPNLAVELGVGMFTTKDGDFTTYEGGGIVEKGSIKVNVIPITLNLKGIYPIDKLDLYALGGIGLYNTKFKLADVNGETSKSKSAVGFQLGVGADYNFMPNVFAGLEFKYLWAKPKFTFDDGSEFKAKIDGMQITANIGYRF